MSGAVRLTAFAGLLALVFAVAAVAGDRVDWTPRSGEDESPSQAGHGEHEATSAAASGQALPGLAVSQNGLTLELDSTTFERDSRTELAFRILGKDGAPVRDFDVEHTKRMHFIAVRRDLTGFQHLHPALRPDGTWAVPLRFSQAGSYRVFADFSTKGVKHTLGADVAVDGSVAARPLPAPAPTTTVDGYRVTLDEGATHAGRESELRFSVTRDGEPVDVDPYLGARGHLVALREGDLAYLHVHPDADELSFMAEFPSAGRYRLFLQFRHAGRVHTAAFTHVVDRLEADRQGARPDAPRR
jgi:hypothetical protein